MAQLVQETIERARHNSLARSIELTCTYHGVSGVKRIELIDGVMEFLRLWSAD